MKKLMIAAAVAAVAGGVFAAPICGELEDTTPAKCYAVYKYTFSGKTTVGVAGKSTTVGNICGDDTVTEGCAIRVPGTLKISGWAAYCFCDCMNTINPNGAGEIDNMAFWMTKPYKADIPDGAVDFGFVNVIGKKGTQAEAAGKFTGTAYFTENESWNLGDLYFAGLGKYSPKQATYSISGNFAGQPAASWYIKSKVCVQTHVWDCTTMTVNCDETPNTVAYGKWSVKYSSSDSKKYMKGKLPSYPSYASVQGSAADGQ